MLSRWLWFCCGALCATTILLIVTTSPEQAVTNLLSWGVVF